MGHSKNRGRRRLTLPLPLPLRAKMIGLAMFIGGFMGLITSAHFDPISARVERVIDGDTIQVRFEGKSYTVRLIGVDTPETKHPTKAVQYFGREASAFTKAALEGKTVLLQKDRTGDTVDRLRALASLRPAGRRQLQRPADPRRLRSCLPALSLLQADGVYSIGRTSAAARNRLMEPPKPQRVVTFDQQRPWNRVLLRPVRAPAPADGRVGRLSERTARNRRFAAPLTRRRSVPAPWTIEPGWCPWLQRVSSSGRRLTRSFRGPCAAAPARRPLR